jgi:hypothetical protein
MTSQDHLVMRFLSLGDVQLPFVQYFDKEMLTTVQSPTQANPTSLPIDYVLNPSPAATPGNSEGDSPYSQADTYPFLTRFVHEDDTKQSDYWGRDLELM